MMNKKNKKILLQSAILIFFAAILVIGLLVYDDYPEFTDEASQRTHSLVNYQYLNQKLLGRTVVEIQQMGLPDLNNYVSKQYGVTLQLPLVFAEDLTNFTMPTRDIYLMRHLYNFIIFFIALVALFFLIKDLLKNEWLALVGTAMTFLFPQFFASSFVNIKDLMFVSLFIIACFFMVRMLTRRRKISYCILFAATAALCSGVRILGIVLPFAAIVCMLMEDIIRRRAKDPGVLSEIQLSQSKNWFVRLAPYIIVLLGTILFYLLFMPASWSDPVGFFSLTTGKALDYDAWDNTLPFAGQQIYWDQAPWYYLPVSMGITIPVYYLIMFFTASGFLIVSVIQKQRILNFVKNRFIWLFLGLFLLPFLFQMLAHVKIYSGWRHMYMLFVPLCILSVFGIQQLHKKLTDKKCNTTRFIVPIITIAALAIGAVRIIIDHPYEISMFNAIGIPVADQYDRNGRASAMGDLRYVLSKYPNQTLRVYGSIGSSMLTDDEKKNLVFVNDMKQNPDFVFEFYRYIMGNQPYVPGYSEISNISIDGYKISSIMKHWSFDMQGPMDIPLDSLNTPKDNSAVEGIQTSGVEGFLVDEPYITLDKGSYVLTYNLTLEDGASVVSDILGFMDIVKHNGTEQVAYSNISKLDSAQNQHDIQLEFSLSEKTQIEFRLYFTGGVKATLNKATMEKMS